MTSACLDYWEDLLTMTEVMELPNLLFSIGIHKIERLTSDSIAVPFCKDHNSSFVHALSVLVKAPHVTHPMPFARRNDSSC